MKKFLFLIAGASLSATMSAATLRVNNNADSGAQFTTFEAAQEAAQDGDVIIFDGSNTSYGKIEVTKRLTLQGPGYFLDVNGVTQENVAPAKFDQVDLKCDGIKVVGLYVDGYLNMRANELIVTRCNIQWVSLCSDYSYTNNYITKGIIHQNYIQYGIRGDSYSSPATFMQVTNNIIARNALFGQMDNSLISRNTAIGNDAGVRQLTNCIIKNNISYNIESDYWANENNSYSNNINIGYDGMKVYTSISKIDDAKIKEVDATIAADKGAFSGDDPYVLSGLATGPVLQDVVIPESVVQGEDLKVTVKIGTSR